MIPNMVAVGESNIPGTAAAQIAMAQGGGLHIFLRAEGACAAEIWPVAPGNGALMGVLASHPEQSNIFTGEPSPVGPNALSVVSESPFEAAGVQHQVHDPVGSAAIDKEAAMRQLLAEAFDEFEFDDISAGVCLRASGGAVRCAEEQLCAEALYHECMARAYAGGRGDSAGIRCGFAPGPRCPRSDAGRGGDHASQQD